MTDVRNALVIQNGTYGLSDGGGGGHGASLDGVTVEQVVARRGKNVGLFDAGRSGQVKNLRIADFTATGYDDRWQTSGDLSGVSTTDVDPKFPG